MEYSGRTYFQQFSGPTIVFEDLPAKGARCEDCLQTKVRALTSFFVSQTFGVSSQKLQDMLEKQTKNDEFLESWISFLKENSRDPASLIAGGELAQDFQQFILPLFKKSLKFTYSFADHKFHQGVSTEL